MHLCERDYNETVLLSRLQAVEIDMGSNQEASGTQVSSGKRGNTVWSRSIFQAGFEGFTADKLARDLMDLLERKIKKCNSHREREVLRYAQHLLQCNGCEKDRLVIEIEISKKCKSKNVFFGQDP